MPRRCLCVPLARAAALDPARVLVRHLFVKRQDDGSLFVLNPSVTDDQNTLARFFGRWAAVSKVEMARALGSVPFARVHFKNPSDSKRVLVAIAEDIARDGTLQAEEGRSKNAVDRWLEEASSDFL